MSTPRRSRTVAVLAAGAALAVAATGAVGAAAAPSSTTGNHRNPNADSSATTGVDKTTAIVRLAADPLATAPSTAPTKGQQLNLTSSAAKSQRATIVAQRNAFKKWLQSTAPKATVTGEYDVAVNAVAVRLNGASLSTLASGPGVASAGYAATYAPSAGDDPDLSLINAIAGWRAASPSSPSTAGRGVKVGIVDTGIDATHPCFSDAGFPATTQLGDKKFTNNKVIVAKVFANKAANLGYTAEAVQDHGSHVAGTVACDANTPAAVDGVPVDYAPSGVAPGAQLGSYNVFPGDIENARSEDILNALQAAATDGMQVINMSLGGNAHGVQDLLTTAVDNLDRANIVVAVSAGNDGPGHYTVGSPGSAERALTAGASSVGHFIGTPVLAGGSVVAITATGDFGVPKADLSGTLVPTTGTTTDPTTLGTGCDAGAYPATVSGNIALVSRGVCTFGNKVSVAEKQGAKGVIVVNNIPGDPVAMAADAAFPTTIPAVMAGQADKAAVVAKAGQTVTISATQKYTQTGNDDIMGDFSSQGPTDVDYRVKPDVVAPGVNVLSSIPHTFCDPTPLGCWAFFQGTSMASPHLAGTAAVVRQAHSTWTAEQVRSAIVNTAQEGVLTKSKAITTKETDPNVIGAGLDDVDAAVGASLALSSVSTSFGAVSSGSGQALSRTITVTNLGSTTATPAVTVTGDPAFSASVASLSIAPGTAKTFTVAYAPAKATAKGDHTGTLRLGSAAHSVLYAFAK